MHLDALRIIACFVELFHVHRNAVLDGLPCRFLEQCHQRDGDVGEHEEREREEVFDLLCCGGTDVVPLGEGGQRAEHEHEQRVVEQAEEDRGERRG